MNKEKKGNTLYEQCFRSHVDAVKQEVKEQWPTWKKEFLTETNFKKSILNK